MPSASDFYTPTPWKDASQETVLPLGAGYAIVLGFGAFFSVFTSLLVFLDTRYGGTKMTSEQFNTAGRSVKIGLTAAVIVSQWTWAATLLQSSNVAWLYGVSGPFWYAAGASIQVLLFGILAIEIKIKAPTAHTFLELVYARWGKASHIVFMIYGFMTNIIVTSMLLLGGSAVVNALTGMDINLASFLIPWGVIIYTLAGGLKATFLASYIHTAVIFVCLITFVFLVYAGSDKLGDSGTVYDKLALIVSYPTPTEAEVAQGYHCGPVPQNKGGSHLTMISGQGLMFGIINIIGNFGARARARSPLRLPRCCARARAGAPRGSPRALLLTRPNARPLPRARARHRLHGPVVLAVGHRGEAVGVAQGLHARRPRVVHHPLRARHLARPRGHRARCQAHAG